MRGLTGQPTTSRLNRSSVTASNSALWAERTPACFVFDMTAFRLFTGHQIAPKFFPKDLQAELPKTDKKNVYYKDFSPPIGTTDTKTHAFTSITSGQLKPMKVCDADKKLTHAFKARYHQ